MYLPAKFGGHRSYRNRYINSYTNSYMDTLEKPELAALIRHIAIFLKSGMPIYNYEVPNTADRRRKRKRRRRRRRRRTQAITKRHEFHANAIIDRGVWIYFLITIAVTRLRITLAINLVVFFHNGKNVVNFSSIPSNICWYSSKRLKIFTRKLSNFLTGFYFWTCLIEFN